MKTLAISILLEDTIKYIKRKILRKKKVRKILAIISIISLLVMIKPEIANNIYNLISNLF